MYVQTVFLIKVDGSVNNCSITLSTKTAASSTWNKIFGGSKCGFCDFVCSWMYFFSK